MVRTEWSLTPVLQFNRMKYYIQAQLCYQPPCHLSSRAFTENRYMIPVPSAGRRGIVQLSLSLPQSVRNKHRQAGTPNLSSSRPDFRACKELAALLAPGKIIPETGGLCCGAHFDIMTRFPSDPRSLHTVHASALSAASMDAGHLIAIQGHQMR